MTPPTWKRTAETWLRRLRLLGVIDLKKRIEMRARHAQANREFMTAHPGFIPPPKDLAFDAYSHIDLSWYYQSGRDQAEELAALIRVQVQSNPRVLEWGCGPARILRHLTDLLPPGAELYGTDYNPRTVAWCNQALPQLTVMVNALEPPLPFPDAMFDAVFAVSVFTHLSEPMHLEWCKELQRVLKPGGMLMFTSHGDTFRSEVLTDEEQEVYDRGDLVVRGRVEEGKRWFAAFQPPVYVRDRMFPMMTEVTHRVRSSADGPVQDLWVFRAV